MKQSQQQLRQKLIEVIVDDPSLLDSFYSQLGIHTYEDVMSDAQQTSPEVHKKVLNGSNITPLMVACDKSLDASLVNLRSKIDEKNDMEATLNLWGHPTEKMSEQEGGNSAAHHALAAGFAFGLDTIEFVSSCCLERSTPPDDKDLIKKKDVETYIAILSQPNANKDTPIMMACVFGHTAILKHILQRYLQLSLHAVDIKYMDLNCSKMQKLWKPIQDIFAIRNEEDCSALNLACGHGKVDTVQLLLQPLVVQLSLYGSSYKVKLINSEDTVGDVDTVKSFICKPLVQVSYEDVKYCKSSLEDLDAELRFMKQQNRINSSHLDEFMEQRSKICQCEDILVDHMNRVASDAMDGLLNEEKSNTTTKNHKTTKKKKQKQSRRGSKSADVIDRRSKDETDAFQVAEQESIGYVSPFITLQDGRVISKKQNLDVIDSLELEQDLPTPSANIGVPESLQRVLKSQLKHQSNDSNANKQHGSFNIEAQMESLCLDPSMLLLSPHGMAMELSPCQLEAMQTILAHQLDGAKEAQSIQKRLLSERNDV